MQLSLPSQLSLNLRAVKPIKVVLSLFFLAQALAFGYGLVEHQPNWKFFVLASFLIPFCLSCFPQYLNHSLFVFSTGLILFGCQPYTVHSQVFILLVAQLGLAFCLTELSPKLNSPVNPFLLKGLLLFVGCAGLSILNLPYQSLLDQLGLWGGAGFLDRFLFAIPDTPEYVLGSFNRLLLFIAWVFVLSSKYNPKQYYQAMGYGLMCGAMIATLTGLAEYFGWVALDAYAPRVQRFRIQSFFGNPGWYAEFISLATPFILAFFFHPKRNRLITVALFSSLVLIEISILLTGSRTSWVVYPVILFVCWLVFYGVTQLSGGGFRKRKLLKIIAYAVVSLPITLVISLLLISLFLTKDRFTSTTNTTNTTNASETSQDTKEQAQSKKDREDAKGQKNLLFNRAQNIANPAARTAIWRDAIYLAGESPVFGLGFESYRFWTTELQGRSDSFYGRHGRLKMIFDTAHNSYLQMLVSVGAVGLLLWLSLSFYGIFRLLHEFYYQNAFFNSSVALSITAFLMYGLTQNMVYIPMIWFLWFVLMGYSLTLHSNTLAMERVGVWWLRSVGAALVVGLLVFGFSDHQLNLAKKYQITLVDQDKQGAMFQGFYPPEVWASGQARWSGKAGEIRFTSGPGTVNFTLNSGDPHSSQSRPVVVRLLLDGLEQPNHQFIAPGKVALSIPVLTTGEHLLELNVSHTWQPTGIGSADSRHLGVGVAGLKVVP